MDSKSWYQIWKDAPIQGTATSSTKLIYLSAGGLGAVSATLLTIGFIVHTFVHKTADLVFAGSVAAMWTAVFGFATSAQNNKARVDQAVNVMQEDKK